MVGGSVGGRGKGESIGGEEGWNILHIILYKYTYEANLIKSTKKKGGRTETGNII